MEDPDRLFVQGRTNPQKFSWPLRSSAGEPPDPRRIADVARLLGRPVSFVDADGYECEMIGATAGPSGQVAFVESRAKDIGFDRYGDNQRRIDVSIRIHLIDSNKAQHSADIESYNPYLGCDVRFFEWIEGAAVLIYSEKHWTFVCRLGDVWPPAFVKIEDDWIINGDTLGYIGYEEEVVQRLRFPELQPLEPISIMEAEQAGLRPGG